MKKLYKFIKVLFSIFLASTYAYLIYLLNDFGFFANKLLLVFCAIILFIIILILIGIFKLKQNILKILLFIVGIIGILINVIGIYYLNSTLDFLENFGNKKQEYDYYYVISLKKNVYKDLSDLKSKKIGMVDRKSVV